MESRCFEFVLYSQAEVDRLLHIVSQETKIKYCYIKHNKDIDDITHKLKKCHYHFIIYYENAHSLQSISKLYNIPENMIELKNNMIKSVEYLIHKNHRSKYQYKPTDVFGTLNYVLLDKLDERVDMLKIINFINVSSHLTWLSLVNYCLDNNLWSTFRRNNYCIKMLLDEHNYMLHNNEFDNILN